MAANAYWFERCQVADQMCLQVLQIADTEKALSFLGVPRISRQQVVFTFFATESKDKTTVATKPKVVQPYIETAFWRLISLSAI
jgi:hypothetical protein